jgi:hypothetical protein
VRPAQIAAITALLAAAAGCWRAKPAAHYVYVKSLPAARPPPPADETGALDADTCRDVCGSSAVACYLAAFDFGDGAPTGTQQPAPPANESFAVCETYSPAHLEERPLIVLPR